MLSLKTKITEKMVSRTVENQDKKGLFIAEKSSQANVNNVPTQICSIAKKEMVPHDTSPLHQIKNRGQK